MTFAPVTIKNLAAYWVAQGGVNLGIVGDTAHAAKGTSYHLGKSQLATGAYSTRMARDKAGLTEAASALDLGRLDGSLIALRAFSLWFAKQCQANRPGTRDVREVIFAIDGTHVVGWSRENGVNSAFISGYGDLSHLTHTHISFYRDSEFRDKVALFQPYFKTVIIPPDTSTGDTNVTIPIGNSGSYQVTLTVGDQLYDQAFKPLVKVSTAQTVEGFFYTGTGFIGCAVATGGKLQLVFVKSDDVTVTAATVTDDDYTAITQAKAVTDALLSGALNQKIADQAAITAANTAAAKSAAEATAAPVKERERIALAEANRVRKL